MHIFSAGESLKTPTIPTISLCVGPLGFTISYSVKGSYLQEESMPHLSSKQQKFSLPVFFSCQLQQMLHSLHRESVNSELFCSWILLRYGCEFSTGVMQVLKPFKKSPIMPSQLFHSVPSEQSPLKASLHNFIP